MAIKDPRRYAEHHDLLSPERKIWRPFRKIRKWLERKLIKHHLDKFEYTMRLKDEALNDLVEIIHGRLYKIADEQRWINIHIANIDKSLERMAKKLAK